MAQSLRAEDGRQFIFRCSTEEDVQHIERLARTLFFSMGLRNYRIYFQCSGIPWQVAVDKKSGEIVAFNINHQLPGMSVRFGYLVYCRPDVQDLKISRRFDTMHYSSAPMLGNATANSVKRYSFYSWAEKLVEYSGFAQPWRLDKPAESDRFKLLPLSEKLMNDLSSYDLAIHGLVRDVFNRLWCTDGASITLVCTDQGSGKLVGYGCLRWCDHFHFLAPLYADDQEVAERLFYELVQTMGEVDHVCMLFTAANRLMTSLANRMGLRLTNTEMRTYQKGASFLADQLKMDKVYCMHDFWPV